MTSPAPASRRRRRLVIGILASCSAMLAFIVASLIAPGSASGATWLGIVCFSAVFVAFPAVGGLIALRRPGHPIGWLFLLIGATETLSIFSTEYAGRALFSGWPLPGVELVTWAGVWTFLPGVGAAVTLVPLLFPDGRFLGRGWRVVGWVAAVVLMVASLSQAMTSGPIGGFEELGDNPFGVSAPFDELVLLVSNISFLIVVLLGVLSIGSLAVRYRRGGRVERAQIKWFASAVALFLGTLTVAFAIQVDDVFTIAIACLAMIPIATGIAILRYRLFDIDRIVSRTVGWLLVTVVLVGLFATAILVAQALLEPVTGGTTVGVAISTLVVAASFTPVRSRVQRTVDRRFNRARYDAERTAASFGGRLRDEVDLRAIADDLAGTIGDTLAPATIGIWLAAGSAKHP